jgi:hypothetical protein
MAFLRFSVRQPEMKLVPVGVVVALEQCPAHMVMAAALAA